MNLDLRKIPAVYINLLQDTGRNNDMKKLCKKCEFETVIRIDAEYTPNSLAGCSMSHYNALNEVCLLYTSPSPRDATLSRMPSSA